LTLNLAVALVASTLKVENAQAEIKAIASAHVTNAAVSIGSYGLVTMA